VKQVWQYGLVQGGSEQDFTEIIRHMEKWSGVTGRESKVMQPINRVV
jgi:hypothetical protein